MQVLLRLSFTKLKQILLEKGNTTIIQQFDVDFTQLDISQRELILKHSIILNDIIYITKNGFGINRNYIELKEKIDTSKLTYFSYNPDIEGILLQISDWEEQLKTDIERKERLDKEKEKLKTWALDNGSELLKKRISFDEKLSWITLAEDEWLQKVEKVDMESFLPWEKICRNECYQKEFPISSPTLEEIQNLEYTRLFYATACNVILVRVKLLKNDTIIHTKYLKITFISPVESVRAFGIEL